MKITNKYNLPEAVYAAASKYVRKPNNQRFSVSDLITPSWQRKLKIENWDNLTEDCSDRLWSIMGGAVHALLEKHAPDNSLSEEFLSVPFTIDNNVYTITGMADLYHNEIVSDYKITSVYSFLLNEKLEWTQQLNVYGYLYRKLGFGVKGLQIVAILRDWQRSKSVASDYPPIAFHTVEIPLWSEAEQHDFIQSRILSHLNPEPCSPEERWRRPTTYAIMRKGRKKAVKVCSTLEEAEANREKGDAIAIRDGKDIKCELYCNVSDFCTVKVITGESYESQEYIGGEK